jgi:hypothetical protein
MFDESKAEKLKVIYKQILSDVLQNKNLEKHLKDVDGAIDELKDILSSERVKKGKPTPLLDDVLNDFYYLKYQILERT